MRECLLFINQIDGVKKKINKISHFQNNHNFSKKYSIFQCQITTCPTAIAITATR